MRREIESGASSNHRVFGRALIGTTGNTGSPAFAGDDSNGNLVSGMAPSKPAVATVT